MVAIKEIRAANASLKTAHDSLTAVFVGATNGIGLATLKTFAKHIPHCRAIIVGRSRSKFAPELENLRKVNPNGEYTFIQSDISLMKNIDTVCTQIKSHLGSTKIDLLYTSQGYINFSSRDNNAEGLDNSFALRYYGRVRFTQNLLPLMRPHGRAVTILAGGLEGKIFEDDLDLERNYGLVNGMGHFASLMTLSYDAFAAQNPERGFVHVYPGVVNTGLLRRSASGFLGWVMRWIVEPVTSLFAQSVEESGERMLYYGTNEGYGKGTFAVDSDGTVKEVATLKKYRERGFGEKVVEHNLRVFERVTAK